MADDTMENDPRAALYKRFRGQVEHENILYNNRVTWLIALNALLFPAVGLLMQGRIQSQDHNNYSLIEIDIVLFVVALVGIMVAHTAKKVLRDARDVLDYLRSKWNKMCETDGALATYLHPSGGEGIPTRPEVWFRSGNLPNVFLFAWGVLLLLSLVMFAIDLRSYA
jgi:hypothetical protein